MTFVSPTERARTASSSEERLMRWPSGRWVDFSMASALSHLDAHVQLFVFPLLLAIEVTIFAR